MVNGSNGDKTEFIKKEVEQQVRDRLYLVFMMVGIVSFSLGAIVNYITIKKLNGKLSK
jgi:hypothetical protein